MKWTMNRRQDRNGLIEYICECGVGHPVYASALWIAESIHGENCEEKHIENEMVHGCCGCCARDDFPGDTKTSLKKAHEIIRNQNERIEELEKTSDRQSKKDRAEVSNAHDMLDELNAAGNRGMGSIRERLDALLMEYLRGRPLPTREQISYARFKGRK